MKKVVMLSLILICSIFLVACGGNSFEDTLKIKLDSDPSTGNVWEFEMNELGIVKIDEENKVSCNEEGTDCSGYQLFKVTGLREGQTRVTFKYAGESYNPLTYYYVITVNKDLKVKETHSKATERR